MTVQPATAPVQQRLSKSALTSLILGILGCVPFITGALALLLGIIGFVKTGKPGVTGRWMAIVGSILGLISIFFWLLFGATMTATVFGVIKVTEGPRIATHDFIRDLSTGDIAGAKSLAGPFSDEDMSKLQDYVQKQGAFKDTTFPSTSINNDTAHVDGTAEFSTGSQHVSATLQKDGGDWKVYKIDITP